MTAQAIAPEDGAGNALLAVDDVAVHFGGIKAVDGLSFRLETGKVHGIIGPNGSGKTTLLAAITRHQRLTRGRVVLDGHDLAGASADQVAQLGVGRTFQIVRLLPELTVWQNVALGADLRSRRTWRGARSAAAEHAARVDRLLEVCGLSHARELYPTQLSYGSQRRIEIARALATDPKLLLLDEPTAGMNRQERTEIGLLMQQLAADGVTQLLVEHDVQMMVDSCSHLFAMNFGRLIAEGRPADVVRNPEVREAYLGKKGRGDA